MTLPGRRFEGPTWFVYLWGAALLVGGLLLGRGCRPEPEVREVERVEYRDREVERVVYRDRVVEARQERRHVVRERVERPDGTRVEREIESSGVDVQRAELRTVEGVREREVQQTAQRERVVRPALPDWRTGALVGVGVLPPGPLVLGAKVERRILGPVWLGAWALQSGQAGASLAVEF